MWQEYASAYGYDNNRNKQACLASKLEPSHSSPILFSVTIIIRLLSISNLIYCKRHNTPAPGAVDVKLEFAGFGYQVAQLALQGIARQDVSGPKRLVQF